MRITPFVLISAIVVAASYLYLHKEEFYYAKGILTDAIDGHRHLNNYSYITGSALVLVLLVYLLLNSNDNKRRPPVIPHYVPILGSAMVFKDDPLSLLKQGVKDYGEAFSIKMLGKDMYILTGEDGHRAFYEAPESVLSARKAYGFTVPVFGPNVIYDCQPEELIQQRKVVSTGLTAKSLASYVDCIVEEVAQYVAEHWGDSGEADLLEELNTIVILTSTRALQGKEVRSRFTKEFASLYMDLDKALGPISFYFPHAPIPTHWKRDKAREVIGQLYQGIIDSRRSAGDKNNDIIQHIMDSPLSSVNKTAVYMNDEQIIGMCIGLLLAGQHTSNVTSTWFGCEILQSPEILQRVIKELDEVIGEEFNIDFEKYKKLNFMQSVIKETLRLHPPIILVMRKTETDFPFKEYVIPKNSFLCVSPLLSMRSSEFYTNPEKFDPDRFNNEEIKKSYQYIPFSAGKHACIGERFAYLQISIIWAYLLRKYKMQLISSSIVPDYSTLIVAPKGPIKFSYTLIK